MTITVDDISTNNQAITHLEAIRKLFPTAKAIYGKSLRRQKKIFFQRSSTTPQENFLLAP